MTVTRENKLNAFTLVEVLIVVVVIGILAAAIMFASDEMVSSAQAARILADLETWKQAAIAWYNDHTSIVTYKGMIDDEYGKELGNTTTRKSGFREDLDGGAAYGVIRAKNILPYVNNSGLRLQKKAYYVYEDDTKSKAIAHFDGEGVYDGYGGHYMTDFATLNEYGTATSNDNYINGNPDEYIWMIDYELPNMSEKLKEKLQRKYVNSGLLFWKFPGQSMQYSSGKSKELNSIGILVLDFSLINETRN